MKIIPMKQCIIKVPKDQEANFRAFWKELRISEAIALENDLPAGVCTENFDGASMTEWAIPLIASVTPLISAALGYLIAIRGEIEIPYRNGIFKGKGIKPSQLAEIIKILENHSNDGST
jgi:hypothetical protein